MTSPRRRLVQLEDGNACDPQVPSTTNYNSVIYRTNVSGLASLEDYSVAFKALGAENREWLCAQLPLFEVLDRVCGLVTDVPMMALLHPPGEPLPAEIQHRLEHLEEVVTATGNKSSRPASPTSRRKKTSLSVDARTAPSPSSRWAT